MNATAFYFESSMAQESTEIALDFDVEIPTCSTG